MFIQCEEVYNSAIANQLEFEAFNSKLLSVKCLPVGASFVCIWLNGSVWRGVDDNDYLLLD